MWVGVVNERVCLYRNLQNASGVQFCGLLKEWKWRMWNSRTMLVACVVLSSYPCLRTGDEASGSLANLWQLTVAMAYIYKITDHYSPQYIHRQPCISLTYMHKWQWLLGSYMQVPCSFFHPQSPSPNEYSYVVQQQKMVMQVREREHVWIL